MAVQKSLKQALDASLVKEDGGGAVGAGAVAGHSMPLFSTMVKRAKLTDQQKAKKKLKKSKIMPFDMYNVVENDMMGMDGGDGGGMGGGGASIPPQSSPPPAREPKFDPQSVISKLRGLEHSEKADRRNTVSFGLEDDEGNIIRVVVQAEQAEDFEKVLQNMLASVDGEDDGHAMEIAEVLFKLKERFQFVEVTWPKFEEDQEEVADIPGAEGEASPEGDDPTGDAAEGDGDDLTSGMDDLDLGDLETKDPALETPATDEGSLLTQVLDMMKADAEARKAEAEARQAEARTKEADSRVAQSLSRVKQEEQFMDMDNYNKAKRDEEREVKRLAQLARWKHDMKSGDREPSFGSEIDDDSLPLRPNPEEEEMRGPSRMKPQQPNKGSTIRGRVSPFDVAQHIIDRIKPQ